MTVPQALAFAALLAASPVGRAAQAGEPTVITLDRDDIDVTTDVVVKPGVYRVEDKNGDGVLRIKADGVTVAMKDVTLIGAPEGREPDSFVGVGVNVEGRKNVSVEGGAIRGFRVGVRGSSAPGLRLERIDASHNRAMRLKSTPEREDESDWLWPHENDDGQWEKNYGAGFSLTSCEAARVTLCTVRRGQNGLLLTRCDRAAVERCHLSFNSGWGIAMYRSSGCRVERNVCRFCVRGYSHGVYARGQDSAGILVFEQCHDNTFQHNAADHSGDGFFLYAGNETLKRTGKGGCNRNVVRDNDFSFAVANGIEATFSEGNAFERNLLSGCDHGVWAGYSYRTKIRGNWVTECANGISIEHGHENEIEGNFIAGAGTGLHLWWDPDPDLTGGVYGKAQDTSSSRNVVRRNWIGANDIGVRLASDAGTRIEENVIAGRVSLLVTGTTRDVVFAGNIVHGVAGLTPTPPTVQCDTDAPLALAANWWDTEPPGGAPTLAGRQKVVVASSLPKPPEIPLPAFDVESNPGSRSNIFIDEWGPLDPAEPGLFPATQSAAGEAKLHAFGGLVPLSIVSVTDGFVVEPWRLQAPTTLKVRRKDAGAAPSLAPFEVVVKIGEKPYRASGTILSTSWTLKFYGWTKDPREDPVAWKALLAAPPIETYTTNSVDFAWGSAAPSPKVPADRFATVAETALTLPPGPYLVRTTSDDGIRVIVDGKIVLEDWTHHAPKSDSIPITLTEGAHTFRVEHFEIDGWAALRFAIEPAVDHR